MSLVIRATPSVVEQVLRSGHDYPAFVRAPGGRPGAGARWEGPAGEREGVRRPAHSREHPESTDRPRLGELFACQLDEREKI
jgi:hypothetical protein